MGVIAKQILYIKEESGFVPIGTLQGDKGLDGKSIYQICLDHGYTGTEEDINLYVSKLPEIYEKLYGNEYHFNNGQSVYIHDDDIFYAGRSITEMFKEYESRIRSMETESWIAPYVFSGAYYPNNDNIEMIVFTDIKPSDEIISASSTKDIRDKEKSDIPIYSWYDSILKTQNIYSDANRIVFSEDCMNMFYGLKSLTSIQFNYKIDTSNVTNMKYMFAECPLLASLDLRYFDTSNVTSINYFVSKSVSLNNINDIVKRINTSKVSAMYGIFMECTQLTDLDLTPFSTLSLANTGSMFSNTSINKLTWKNADFTKSSPWSTNNDNTIKTLDISGSKLGAGSYFSAMGGCSVENIILKDVDFSEKTDLSSLLPGLSTVEHIDFSNKNPIIVTGMRSTFSSDSSLKSLDLSAFDTSACETFVYTFNNCSSLTDIIYGDKFVLPDNITSLLGYDDDTNPTYQMFYNCPANKPNWTGGTWTENGTYIFQS